MKRTMFNVIKLFFHGLLKFHRTAEFSGEIYCVDCNYRSKANQTKQRE